MTNTTNTINTANTTKDNDYTDRDVDFDDDFTKRVVKEFESGENPLMEKCPVCKTRYNILDNLDGDDSICPECGYHTSTNYI